MKNAILLVVGTALIMGCTTADTARTDRSESPKGFLDGYYAAMKPGPEEGARMRWLKPGVDFSKYEKVMLDSVVFFFSDDSEYKGVDPEKMKEIADAANLRLVSTIQEKYPVVSERGPDVVRVRVAITDLKQSRPVLSGVTTVIPVGLGVSLVKKGATGAWSGSGATTIELMALDSMTNDVIAVAQDEKSAGFAERFSKWGSTDEAFQFWGERICLFLDSTRASK
ncbi:MAG: DUF3313 domain-containing protein [Desulfobacterales bacterium]